MRHINFYVLNKVVDKNVVFTAINYSTDKPVLTGSKDEILNFLKKNDPNHPFLSNEAIISDISGKSDYYYNLYIDPYSHPDDDNSRQLFFEFKNTTDSNGSSLSLVK